LSCFYLRPQATQAGDQVLIVFWQGYSRTTLLRLPMIMNKNAVGVQSSKWPSQAECCAETGALFTGRAQIIHRIPPERAVPNRRCGRNKIVLRVQTRGGDYISCRKGGVNRRLLLFHNQRYFCKCEH
jgi:hypothetical protein